MTLWESGTTTFARHLVRWESQELSWEDPEGLAEWFQHAIREHGWKDTVDLLAPRSLVNLHLLDLPNASSDRLGSILPLQMESLYGEKAESTAFDFVPLKLPADSPSASLVLLATIPREFLTSMQHVCRLAGLEPHRVLFRDLISRAEWKTSDLRMHTFVWLDDQSRTMGLAIGKQVIRTLSIPMTDPSPPSISFMASKGDCSSPFLPPVVRSLRAIGLPFSAFPSPSMAKWRLTGQIQPE